MFKISSIIFRTGSTYTRSLVVPPLISYIENISFYLSKKFMAILKTNNILCDFSICYNNNSTTTKLVFYLLYFYRMKNLVFLLNSSSSYSSMCNSGLESNIFDFSWITVNCRINNNFIK